MLSFTGRIVSSVLTAWFVAVFALITAAGIGFLGTVAYHLVF